MPYKPELKLTRCPFNPQHVFTLDRLQGHLLKCERNYPNHYTCPFYSLHRFLDKDERDAHVFVCDRRTKSQPWLYERSEKTGKIMPTVELLDIPQEKTVQDEDWETEYS